jgi:hypothetical protein
MYVPTGLALLSVCLTDLLYPPLKVTAIGCGAFGGVAGFMVGDRTHG